jgi:hypothetical protein
MKKFVSIILTTGLLMGTVAFGALACDRKGNGNGPDQFQGPKKMERYQPPMKKRHNRGKMIVKVEVKKPGPVPARMARKPAPAPRPNHRLMPKPGSEREQRRMLKPNPERHNHDRQPRPERLGRERD